jgi:fatty acid kinase
VSDPSLVRFRTVLEGALAHLESRRQEINDLNVFPVADGDTGDNMALTLRAVLAELDRISDDRTIDEIGRDAIVDSVARAALLGARGNSGVILSQLIRGAAEELISRPGELVDPTLVGAAMARAADRAYASVREPAEGTILTVVREMATRLASELAHMPEPRLGPDTDDDRQDAAIADVLERAVRTGEQAVERGPQLLKALRDAGVVDAGGYGLVVLFAGAVAALRGEEAPAVAHHAPAKITHPEHESSTYRYCTNFAVTGAGLDADRAIERLERIGDSVLVVGDPHTLKIHVHTDDPALATAVFDGAGEVSHLDVADMHEQVAERTERLTEEGPAAACGLVAVASGDGMRRLFESVGAWVVDGGPTMNPSTYDLLAGIHACTAESVVVLPNSPNVVMAAEKAAELSEKDVRVVFSRTPQGGLSAALALDPEGPLEDNAAALEEALGLVRTGGVARASRADGDGRFGVGEAVGYVEEELVAWGDPEATLARVVERLAEGAELITCLSGKNAPLDEATITALVPDGVELELRAGDQAAWWWLLAAE